jgi:hypothetical protein
MVMLGVEGFIWKGGDSFKNPSKYPLQKRHDHDEIVQPRSMLKIKMLNILKYFFFPKLELFPDLTAESQRPALVIYSVKMEPISCIMMGLSLVLSMIILQFL